MAVKKKPKGGLGRGLSAILPDEKAVNPKSEGPISPADIGKIPVSQIEMINQFQPREHFDEDALDELADSIKLHGIIQPLTVRRLEPGKYQLIAGERRLRASKKAGLTEVPVFIRTANDEQMLEMALIENIQREDLNPIEIANSYKRMIDELQLKQEELGDKVGKKRSTVTNYLSLLKLPVEIAKAVKDEEISMGHAKAIKSLSNKVLQLQVYRDILDKNLSVRQAEQVVRNIKTPKEATEKSAPDEKKSVVQIHLQRIGKQLTEKFGNRVNLKQNAQGKGEISITYSSNEDLNRILEILDL